MSKIGKVVGGVAIALAIAMSAGACLQVFGKGKVKPTEWFNKQQQTEVTNDITDSGCVLVKPNEGVGVSLMTKSIAPDEYASYGVSARATQAQELTVVFTPESATNKNITFTSDDTSGKVTVTKTGPNKATVTVTGSFQKQVKITCTSEAKPDLSVTCTVDYLDYPRYETGYDMDYTSIRDAIDFDVNYGGGSIRPTSIVGYLQVYLDGGLVNHLKGKGWNVTGSYTCDYDFYNDAGKTVKEMFFSSYGEIDLETIYSDIANYYNCAEDTVVLTYGIDNVYTYYGDVEYYYDDGAMIEDAQIVINSWRDVTILPYNIRAEKTSLVFGSYY